MKFNKEVSITNKLNQVAIDYTKEDETSLLNALPVINIAIGAALRGLYTPKIKINLLPMEEIIKRRLKIQKIVVSIITSFFIILLIFLSSLKARDLVNKYRKTIEINKRTQELKSSNEDLIKMKDSLDKFDLIILNIAISKAINKSWPNSLSELSYCVPEGMWFERFDANSKGMLSITGKVGKGKLELIELFITNCSKSKNFVGTGTKGSNDSDEYTNFEAGRREESRKLQTEASR